MPDKSRFGLVGEASNSYLALVLAFPLASTRSDEHLGEAQKVMDRLLAKGELDQGEPADDSHAVGVLQGGREHPGGGHLSRPSDPTFLLTTTLTYHP
jgi:hypothetical protein